MIDAIYSAVARTVLSLLQPIALIWLGLLVLTVGLWWKKQRGFAVGAAFLAVFMQTIGGTAFSIFLLERLERPFAASRPDQLPECDAVVMLGGAVEPSLREVGNLHLTSAGDRLVMAIELIRLRKAPVLCVSGGHAKFGKYHWVEADMIKRVIDERQLVSVPVISYGARQDTHDEAVYTRKLAAQNGWKRILLVTSAVHMRRALAVFRHEGLDTVPAPCNFLTTMSLEAEPPFFGIPTFLGFVYLSTWIHEEVGWLEYRRRGWIDPAS